MKTIILSTPRGECALFDAYTASRAKLKGYTVDQIIFDEMIHEEARKSSIILVPDEGSRSYFRDNSKYPGVYQIISLEVSEQEVKDRVLNGLDIEILDLPDKETTPSEPVPKNRPWYSKHRKSKW